MNSTTSTTTGSTISGAILPPSILPACAYSTLRPEPSPMSYSTFSSTGQSGDFKVFTNKVNLSADAVYTAVVTTYVGATLDYQLSLCNDTAPLSGGLAQCVALR